MWSATRELSVSQSCTPFSSRVFVLYTGWPSYVEFLFLHFPSGMLVPSLVESTKPLLPLWDLHQLQAGSRLHDQGLPVDGEPGCLHHLPLQGTTLAKDAFSSSRLPSCAWHRVDRQCIAEILHGQMLQDRLSKIKIHEFLCSGRVYIASSAIS